MHETYDFDVVLPRRENRSFKWTHYEPDVLPLWVADTDFVSPSPVIEAIQARAATGQFGYEIDSPPLREVIAGRMARLYGWHISADDVVFWPTLVTALNGTVKLYGGGGPTVQLAPIYFPFLGAPKNFGQTAITVPLVATQTGQRLHYEIDFDALEAAITPECKLLMFCNPHNPVGRMFTRGELECIAEIVLRRDLMLVSDEIHCEIVMDSEREHVPLASLGPEVATRTVTLNSPSKLFNLPGLHCGYAIVTDKAMRDAMIGYQWSGLVPSANPLGLAAVEAAYRHGQPYVDQLLPYLRANRDAVVEYVEAHLPDVGLTVPEATFLMWMDFRKTPIADDPFTQLKDKGRVALNDGKLFGNGEGFARLNYGCPRSVLMNGLERIRKTLEDTTAG